MSKQKLSLFHGELRPADSLISIFFCVCVSWNTQTGELLAAGEYSFPEMGCLKLKLKAKLELCESMWAEKQRHSFTSPCQRKELHFMELDPLGCFHFFLISSLWVSCPCTAKWPGIQPGLVNVSVANEDNLRCDIGHAKLCLHGDAPAFLSHIYKTSLY